MALGVVAALALVAQAWLLAEVIAGHGSLARRAGGAAGGRARPGRHRLARRDRRRPLLRAGEVRAARGAADARHRRRRGSTRRARWRRWPRAGSTRSTATSRATCRRSRWPRSCPWSCSPSCSPATGSRRRSSLVTLPLIPLFMALVGATTRERMDAQVRSLQRLGGHFLDVVAGLPTLKVFGRAKPQAAAIATVSSAYREQALGTLRIAFLSSLVLELLASLAMALVAVAIGLRLLSGSLGLETALFVLVLAPEAYLPLRRLGESYHAGAEGAAAATQILDVLDEPLPARGTRTEIPAGPIEVDGLLAAPGARRAVADRRAGRGRGDHRPQRMREVDAPAGAARARDAHGGRGPRRRHGPARARPRGLARAAGLGSAAPAPVRGDDRRQRPARPPGRARRGGLARARRRAPRRGDRRAARRPADAARRPRRGPVGRRAPAPRARARVPARRAAAAARRADRRPGRRHRGRGRARDPPARARPHRRRRRAPPGAARASPTASSTWHAVAEAASRDPAARGDAQRALALVRPAAGRRRALRAARRGGRVRGGRPARDVGVADRARRAAAGSVGARRRDRRRPVLRALARAAALRRAARRPRRGVPGAGGAARQRLPAARAARARRAARRSARATCWRGSCTTSTRCRTCSCGSCSRSRSR